MKMKKILSLALAVSMTAAVALTGCGDRINDNDVVATLDGEDIPLGLANFMAQYTAVSYDAMYLTYMGEDMWTSDPNNAGVTMTDSVRNGIMNQLQTNYLLDAHMEDYGVSITDEEMAAMEQAADAFLESNSDEAIKAMGATKEYIVEMLRLNLVQTKMQQAIYDTVDTEVSDEEAAQRTFSYIRISTEGHYDDNGNYVSYTEDELAELDESAEKTAMEASDDFEKAAEDNGYTVSTYSYGDDEIDEDGAVTGSMDISVIQAADALSEGQVSELIEVEGKGYYILRLDQEMDQEATDKKKDEIVSERQSDKYNEVVEGYKDACEWEINEKQLKKINFDELYTIKQENDTESGSTESTDNTEG